MIEFVLVKNIGSFVIEIIVNNNYFIEVWTFVIEVDDFKMLCTYVEHEFGI